VEGLSPKAANRVAREAAVQTFDPAARAINMDWGTSYDGKQIQRWGEALGQAAVDQREAQREAYERGERPASPSNDAQLLVIGMDGGRVQGREKNADTGSRWKEDKVLTISSYLRGDGKDKPPVKLVNTYVATMGDSDTFGKLAVVEAERRGLRRAQEVIVLGDGGNWIDTQWQAHFALNPRIIDFYHAVEHLHDCAKAAYGQDEGRCKEWAGQLKDLLWDGRVQEVIAQLRGGSQRVGPPQEGDGPQHPRRVLAQNVGYFERHAPHMNYPEYRRRGWPIASGVTESGVKLFNKRVKGTEQFWNTQGVEPILALRALWLSEDQRWDHYWLCPTPRKRAA